MANLTVYYPTTEERDTIKDELAGIAASFGFHTVHESAERGNIRELLNSIASGETALLLLADTQKMIAIETLSALLPTLGVLEQDAIDTIISSLQDALRREGDG